MRSLPPHIAITYQPKSVYEPIKRTTTAVNQFIPDPVMATQSPLNIAPPPTPCPLPRPPMNDQFPGATKKVLSPAAQAVLDACDQAFDQCGTTAQGLAAALRALAHNVDSDEILTFGGSYYVLVIERDDILAIANELESQ